MWGLMHEWLKNPPSQLPDDDSVEIDLCGLRYSYNSHGAMKLESKDEAVKRGIKSPDDGDAIALTWAMPVQRSTPGQRNFKSFGSTVSGMG